MLLTNELALLLPLMEQVQELVDSYFESATSYWDQLYSTEDLLGRIYQRRQQVTLKWIQRLGLPVGAQVADIGCGAGSMAVMLARMGHKVVAVDRVPAMLQVVHDNATRAGVSSSIEPMQSDVCALQLPANEFHVTVALGLLPWIKHPQRALAEMARVTRPGGHLIVSADNALRLNNILDPFNNPVLALFWRSAVKAVRAAFRRQARMHVQMHWPSEFNRLIHAEGLHQLGSTSVGFGPFTIFRRPLFTEPSALRIDECLQTYADRKFPVLATTGAHYLVLARKTDRSS
jgi:ubiquinone/menaquinone biosynthesis C-methylase UbiE